MFFWISIYCCFFFDNLNNCWTSLKICFCFMLKKKPCLITSNLKIKGTFKTFSVELLTPKFTKLRGVARGGFGVTAKRYRFSWERNIRVQMHTYGLKAILLPASLLIWSFMIRLTLFPNLFSSKISIFFFRFLSKKKTTRRDYLSFSNSRKGS